METKITKIDKEKTALVVIDLQNGIAGREGLTPHTGEEVVANAKLLAEAFRKNNMPVFLFNVSPSTDHKDSLTPITDHGQNFKATDMPADWKDFVPGLYNPASDFVLTKRQWGGFYGTELDLQLHRRGIDTIVLCGISTNIGVESTARQAYELGYNQIFIEDASTAFSAEEHQHSFKYIFKRIGRVRNTNDILENI
jgi:nicotinamidase-related amidase